MAKKPRHPPKDKKTNRPRPLALVPLGNEARDAKSKQEFSKALLHLDEAKILAPWGMAPNACVHSSYYAMYHAATAVVLATGGVGKRLDAPENHVDLVKHFGIIASKKGVEFEELGKVLLRAQQDRIVSDYGLISGASSSDASELAKQAVSFIAVCQTAWGLKPSRHALEEMRELINRK